MGKIKYKILDIVFKKELQGYDRAVDNIRNKVDRDMHRMQRDVEKKTGI